MPRKSTRARSDFPLFKHARGYWAKKVRQRLVYFGKVSDDPSGKAALVRWLDQRDDLLAGRKPREKDGGPTVADAINGYLESQQLKVDNGEITERHFRDQVSTAKRTAQILGRNRPLTDIRPDDGRKLKVDVIARRHTVSGQMNEITRTKAPFTWAFKNGLIDRPVMLGTDFTAPSRSRLRIERSKRRPADWLFTADDVRKLLDAASVHLRPMILLAVQAGFGPSDLANLPLSALDLSGGWITFPRVKTGIRRRVPLWNETIEALRASLAKRPAHKTGEAADKVFVTKHGDAWGDGVKRFPVCAEFGKLVKKLGMQKTGRGLYALRHLFRTIAGSSRDAEAVRAIMGHTSGHIEEVYIHGIDDERLRAVVDCVHSWLFPAAKDGAQ